MLLSATLTRNIWLRLEPTIHRVPDEIIGHQARWRSIRPDGAPVDKPFLLRWYIGGEKNRGLLGCNAYLHQFIRDDEDRALHDHPWPNVSIVLGGQYIEHTIDVGGVHRRHIFRAGAVKFRSAKSAHRVELTNQFVRADGSSILGDCPIRAPILPQWCKSNEARSPSWSLFLTGPATRTWGFHCPEAGWRSSHEFHDRGGCT